MARKTGLAAISADDMAEKAREYMNLFGGQYIELSTGEKDNVTPKQLSLMTGNDQGSFGHFIRAQSGILNAKEQNEICQFAKEKGYLKPEQEDETADKFAEKIREFWRTVQKDIQVNKKSPFARLLQDTTKERNDQLKAYKSIFPNGVFVDVTEKELYDTENPILRKIECTKCIVQYQEFREELKPDQGVLKALRGFWNQNPPVGENEDPQPKAELALNKLLTKIFENSYDPEEKKTKAMASSSQPA